MTSLKGVTSENIDTLLMEEETSNWLCSQILALCGKYARQKNLIGYDYEDYVHDLFMHIWNNLDKFDSDKSSLSTFCYWMARSFTSNFISKQKVVCYLTLNTTNKNLQDESEDEFIEQVIDVCASSQEILEFEELYNLCSEPTKLWLEGHTQSEISKILGISQTHVSRLIRSNLEYIKGKVRE